MVKSPNLQPLENCEKKLELCLLKLLPRFVGEEVLLMLHFAAHLVQYHYSTCILPMFSCVFML